MSEATTASITFRGVVLKHFDGRQSPDGASYFTRVHFAAEFSDTVREQMEWDDPGDCIKPGSPANLTGELLGHNLILTPGDKKLKDFELQFGIKDVSQFQVITLKDDEGEPAGRQLRFIVRTPEDGAAGYAEQYIRRVGRHESQMKISYVPQAKQEPLPLADGAAQSEPDTGCIQCNNSIPFADGSDAVHASGAACTRPVNGSALASASQMQQTATETAKRAAKTRAN